MIRTLVSPFLGDNSDKYEWVPIKPMTTAFLRYYSNEYVENYRNQIPLKISWSLTVWKSYGGIFREKYCINLGTVEAKHGLT